MSIIFDSDYNLSCHHLLIKFITIANKAKNLWKFKDKPGEQLKGAENISWSEKIKKQYTSALFREIATDPEYQELRKEFLDAKKSKQEKEKLFKEMYAQAKTLHPALEEVVFRKTVLWEQDLGPAKESKTEKSESPVKKLEKERKDAAIAELERLGMKTDENVEKINAIKFLDDKILIGNTPWAYINMKWWKWVFKKETHQHYYNFEERKAEAKNQWIVLPGKKDFVDTLKALPGKYSENNWYQWWHILSIILWESRTGCCGSGGRLGDRRGFGYLGSVSEYGNNYAWCFEFDESEGRLYWYVKGNSFVCRPLVNNGTPMPLLQLSKIF